MIYGIGIDIIEKSRIARVYGKYKENFIRHILHPDEIPLFNKRVDGRKVEFLAGRFAAKEAYMKATGLGMRAGFSSIAVINQSSGKPIIYAPHHNPTEYMVHVTITHDTHQAMAQVIIESKN